MPKDPICEMEVDGELHAMTVRFWVSLALGIPVIALAMGGMIPGGTLA